MCTTSEHVPPRSSRNVDKKTDDPEGRRHPLSSFVSLQVQPPPAAVAPTTTSTFSSSQRSSFLTPLSVQSRMDFDEDSAAFSNNGSSASTRVRLRHKRRPSLVQSDDGIDDHDVHGLHSNDDVPSNSAAHHHHLHHATESRFCPQMVLPVCPQMVLPAVCHGADHIDIFMACRHPLDLLGMFQEEDDEQNVHEGNPACESDGGEDGAAVHHVSGYHAIPASCEYCGSQNLEQCKERDDCQRPSSFFPKQRPPFCPKGGPEWDENDLAVELTPDQKRLL